MPGSVFFLQSVVDCHSTHLIGEIKKSIQSQYGVTDVRVVRSSTLHQAESRDYASLSVSEVLLELYRRHGLSRNDRQTVISYDTQKAALQLCLADLNKQEYDDFTVEISKVLDIYKQYIADTVNSMNDIITKANDLTTKEASGCTPMGSPDKMLTDNTESSDVLTKYKEMLDQMNVIDFAGVYKNVLEETIGNEQLRNEVNEMSLLVITEPCNELEKQMQRFLISDKPCLAVSVELPLTEDGVDGCHVEPTFTNLSLREADDRTENGSGPVPSSASVTEHFIQSVFLSYVELLVNSRQELALAHVLNIPERGLGHKAFTELKRASKSGSRKMAMFQTASSYVIRIRLGGKRYQPDEKSSLSPYVKGLSEFTDFMHKVQEVIEEDGNTRSAVRRVLNVIESLLVRSKENKLRKTNIESVTTRLQAVVTGIIDRMKTSKNSSTPKSAGRGGSALGRDTLRVLRTLLDHAHSQPSGVSSVHVLDDVFSSQRTPIRFPSLLSQFRSPDSPDSAPGSSLADRASANIAKPPKPDKMVGVERFQSCLDWAQPKVNVGIGKKTPYKPYQYADQPSEKPMFCKNDANLVTTRTIDQQKRKTAHIIPESRNDQENAVATNSQSNAHKKTTVGQTGLPVSKKRGLSSVDNTQAKKRPRGSNQGKPPAKKASCKRKLIPQVQGQKSLTSFFRV